MTTPGTYELHYDYTDQAGNIAERKTRTVTIIDTIAPVLSLHGENPIVHEATHAFEDPGALWEDAVDGNGTVYGSGSVDILTPGTYVLVYERSDSSNNQAVAISRNIQVVDTTAPVIALNGADNVVLEAGNPYLDLGRSGRTPWTATAV